MLQDVKDLVYSYKIDLASLELTAMKYGRSGERIRQMYVVGRHDMLKSVRRTLNELIKKNEGEDEII
jgi:hypothetical protein